MPNQVRVLIVLLLFPLLANSQVVRFMGRYDISTVTYVADSTWQLSGTFIDLTGSYTGLSCDTNDKIIQRGYDSLGRIVFDRYRIMTIVSQTVNDLVVNVRSDYTGGIQNSSNMPFTGSFPIASAVSDTSSLTYRTSMYQNLIDPDYDAALDNLNLYEIGNDTSQMIYPDLGVPWSTGTAWSNSIDTAEYEYAFYDTVTLDIPAAQIQSDWNQTNNNLLDYIKNKPTIPPAGALYDSLAWYYKASRNSIYPRYPLARVSIGTNATTANINRKLHVAGSLYLQDTLFFNDYGDAIWSVPDASIFTNRDFHADSSRFFGRGLQIWGRKLNNEDDFVFISNDFDTDYDSSFRMNGIGNIFARGITQAASEDTILGWKKSTGEFIAIPITSITDKFWYSNGTIGDYYTIAPTVNAVSGKTLNQVNITKSLFLSRNTSYSYNGAWPSKILTVVGLSQFDSTVTVTSGNLTIGTTTTTVITNEDITGPKFKITTDGGYAVKMIASGTITAGQIVYMTADTANKVRYTTTGYSKAVGVAFNSATNTEDIWVVVSGRCFVLFNTDPDATVITLGYNAYTGPEEANVTFQNGRAMVQGWSLGKNILGIITEIVSSSSAYVVLQISNLQDP